MSGWEVGDLALCVDDGPVKMICGYPELDAGEGHNLVAGKIYVIDEIMLSRITGLADAALYSHADDALGHHSRFIKVTPTADMESEGADLPAQVPA